MNHLQDINLGIIYNNAQIPLFHHASQTSISPRSNILLGYGLVATILDQINLIYTVLSMDSAAVFADVLSTFRLVFDDDDLEISEATNSSHIDDWDSLNHINLIVALEKKFGVKFGLGEIDQLENVGDLCELIQTKLN